MLRIKSITWLLSFNVIHYSSPLLFSLHLWIHLCLQSDSGVVLSGQSDKLPANNKKRWGTPSIYLSLSFLFHPFVMWFLYSLLGLVALWPVWSCCLGCAPCSFSESIELLQLRSSVFICCWFSLFIVSHLCSSFWFNHRSGQTHHQTPLSHLWLQDDSSVVDFPPLNQRVDLDLSKKKDNANNKILQATFD